MTDQPNRAEQAPWTPEQAGVALPREYMILPSSVPFVVPGFLRHARPTSFVQSPQMIECTEWFEQFVGRVERAVGACHLPVCRMSDGEFLLLFGHQQPSLRHPFGTRLWLAARQYAEIVRRRVRGFRAVTAKGVSSGAMSYAEIGVHTPILSTRYAEIARDGILAMHLSWGSNPFQEHYFPAVGRWLRDKNVVLTVDNYVPFYFVYGLLRGPTFSRLVAGCRLLVVHSATGPKREAILGSLRQAEPRSIEWLTISPTRSFAEILDLARLHDRPDLCLLGAGVGKANLFHQLAPLAVPCLDAGYAFEAWADTDKQWDRPFMTPDTEFDPSRVRF